MRYRWANAAGGTYFFTVNLAARDADTLARHIDTLREVVGKVKAAHPFAVVAMVVLPERLHAYIERGMATRDWGEYMDNGAGGYGER